MNVSICLSLSLCLSLCLTLSVCLCESLMQNVQKVLLKITKIGFKARSGEIRHCSNNKYIYKLVGIMAQPLCLLLRGCVKVIKN